MQVVPVPIDDLISKEYAKRRRAELYRPDRVSFRFQYSVSVLMLQRPAMHLRISALTQNGSP